MSRIEINSLRGAAIVLLAIVMPLSFLVSCGREKKDLVEVVFDRETTYTIKEKNVESLISDSGLTRTKVIAETWLIFGKASEPYWLFPDGAYLERFDSLFNVEASVKADTVYYYERRKLWELNGNVDISNFKGERFRTQQMFVDESKEIFYSDSFIHITRVDGENFGIGFTSNKDMTDYKIFKASANFLVDIQQRSSDDTIPQDSIQLKIENTD